MIPPTEIEALEEALKFFEENPQRAPNVNGYFNSLSDAAHTLLQLLKGEHGDFRAMRNLVSVLLPMAKGYAHEHPVGRNQSIVREVNLRFQELDEKYFTAQEGGE